MTPVPNFRVENVEDADATIVAGDWVKSFDFEIHDDSFVIGRVAAVGTMVEGCPRYELTGFKRVFGGAVLPFDNWRARNFLPPVNGTPHSFGGFCNGVRKIEGEELEYWVEKHADWASDGGD